MTIESQYTRETFAINPAKIYTFTFEHIGSSAIQVYEADAAGLLTLIADSAYTLTAFLQGPVFQGGTVTYITNHLVSSTQVVVIRSTPETQLIDYNAYEPFPADLHEFGLDKLTMIAQEAVEIAVTGGAGGGSGVNPNAFIPITGNQANNPTTGPIQWYNASLGIYYGLGVLPGFGVDKMVLIPVGTPAQPHDFSLYTNDALGASWEFQFIANGELRLPTDYSSPHPTAAATVQYVLDAVGGPGAAFVPLSGTVALEEITGVFTWLNGLGAEMKVGNSAFDVFTLSVAQTVTPQAFIINSGSQATAFPFIFAEDGELTLPNLDYNLVSGEAAVSKDYVDAQVGGAGSVPLIGTAVGLPVTGIIEFDSITRDMNWRLGIDETGFTNQMTLYTGGTSTPSSEFRINCQGNQSIFNAAGGLRLTEIAFGTLTDDGVVVKSELEATFIKKESTDAEILNNGLTVNNANLQCTQSITASVSLNAGNLGTANRMLKTTGGLGGIVMASMLESEISLTSHNHNGVYLPVSNATHIGVFNTGGVSSTAAVSATSLNANNLSPPGVNLVAGGLGAVVPDASDIRLKESIYSSHYGLQHIMQMAPVEFSWKEGTGRAKGRQVGFIAQDMQAVIPEAVPYSEEHDLYGFQDRPIIAALVKGMQEQQAQIDELRNELWQLQK